MASEKVIIGSKLPNGLILRHPLKDSIVEVEIKGLNSAPMGANGARVIIPYATTEVDKDFWEAWKLVHDHESRPFAPLASGAIFEAKTQEAASKIAKERSKEKTGLEPMAKSGDDRMGADKDKLVPSKE
jgi:hypothetical protein